MSEYAFPHQDKLTGAKRLLKPLHGLFWAAAEGELNRVQASQQRGEHSNYPWSVDINVGEAGGRVNITKILLDEATERTVTVNFSRDELDGHMAYLNAERVLANVGDHAELSRDRLLAGPREFSIVEFNPISVISALHAASIIALREQALNSDN